MRRFDDFLKLLLSILIGQVIKEQDLIRSHLSEFLLARAPGKLSGFLAWSAPMLMVMLYLRNIHGSICYDIWVGREKRFLVSYENTAVGRALTQGLSVVALFLIPFAAVHTLEKHVDRKFSPAALAILFLGPILAYFVWNLALFLSTEGKDDSLRLEKTLILWLKLDAASLLCGLGVLFYWLATKPVDIPLRADWIALTVACIMFGTVSSDYIMNREFYFPGQP